MSKTITIDPVTRISGFLEIKAKVEEEYNCKSKCKWIAF